jgi:DNA-binding CsgD family transcriptional regulator/tetratricopeptide (TPR) repeat protein
MLLERESQLGALLQYADEAGRGDGRLALVSGEAGVGKSSLVEELRRRAPDATWLWGACDGLFTPRALAPLHDVARQVGGDLQTALGDASARDRVVDAMLGLFDQATSLLVLVIEDVHWADEATLDLIRLLAKRLRDVRVLMIVTFRDDALAAADPLRIALGELAGQRSSRRIAVPPLTEDAVRRLADGTPYAADALHRLTGGNPFFVAEVLGGRGEEIPASARDAVLARTAALSEPARRVLETAALGGLRVDSDIASRAAGGGLDTLDELVGAGLLLADDGALRFRHELARRAVESQIAPHRRVHLHRALLQVLEFLGCDDQARLAFHAEGAAEATLVARYAVPAARQAARLGAHREAAAQYERALGFPPDDSADLADLYDGYAEELAFIDRWPQAADAREKAIAIWQESGERRREGRSSCRLAWVMWRLCRGPESVAAFRRGIELLEPLGDDPVLAHAYSAHAFDIWDSDPQRAHRMLAEADRISRLSGDQVVRSDVLNNLACAQLARREDWTSTMDEALALALATPGAEGQVGRAYANAYAFYVAQFRFVESERYWRDGIAYCDQWDISTFSTCLRGRRAIALAELGRWDEAAALAERVLSTEASPVNLLTSQISLGLVRARRGLPDVFDLLDPAVEAAEGLAEAEWIAATRLARAEAAWLAEDDESARRDLVRVRQVLTPRDYLEDAALAVWEQRLLGAPGPVSPPPDPWATWLAGDSSAAAEQWDRLGCRHQASMALHDSHCDAELLEALERFEALGADAAARRTRRRMRELGHRRVPSGARAATRDHPAGLTRREDEVLALLCEGLRNEDIAERLVISTRTVDHHVSAVLGKIGVPSRGAAVAEARRRGWAPAAS